MGKVMFAGRRVMPPSRVKFKLCPRNHKFIFPDEKAASRAAAKINLKNQKTGMGDCKPYVCQHCGNWHIGHGEIRRP